MPHERESFTPSIDRGAHAVELLDHRHRDIIHQLAFDVHGRRIATCSSDATVAIYDRTQEGPIWRVEWAAPEFGQVIATCSFDRAVHIWEETPEDDKSLIVASKADAFPLTRWIRRTALLDSRSNVTDVKFAPRHLGLQLATASTQGIVRVYECTDVMELSQWSLSHEIRALPSRCGSVSWCASRMHHPLLAAATDERCDEEKVALFEYHESLRKWQRVSTARFGLSEPVNEVRFSPVSNIDYHVLAVAAADIYIYQIRMPSGDDLEERIDTGHPTEYSAVRLAVLGGDKRAWRLSWNLSGNALTSVTDTGMMRLWKAAGVSKWKLVSEMSPHEFLYDTNQTEEEVQQPPRGPSLAPSLGPNTKPSTVYY